MAIKTRCRCPAALPRFCVFNDGYVRDELAKRIRGTGKDGGETSSQRFRHTEILLSEIETERDMGRIEGPFAAPKKWGFQTVDYRARTRGRAEQLLPAPGDQECYAAFAFPIEQTGSDGQLKIRRGEDWARSGHNGMTLVEDSPVHYNVDH